MGKPRKSPKSKVDLLEIWCYVGEDSPAAADRPVKQMDDAIALLGRFPAVHILRVVHGARDLGGIFADD